MTKNFAFVIVVSAFALVPWNIAHSEDSLKDIAARERMARAFKAAHSSKAAAQSKLAEPYSVHTSSPSVGGNPPTQNLQPPTGYHPPYYAPPQRQGVQPEMPHVGVLP
jgi:hypothetical protein